MVPSNTSTGLASQGPPKHSQPARTWAPFAIEDLYQNFKKPTMQKHEDGNMVLNDPTSKEIEVIESNIEIMKSTAQKFKTFLAQFGIKLDTIKFDSLVRDLKTLLGLVRSELDPILAELVGVKNGTAPPLHKSNYQQGSSSTPTTAYVPKLSFFKLWRLSSPSST